MSAALTTNVDQRLLRTTKFPSEFNVKVDMRKVNIHLIKSWAQIEIANILQNDDDVVSELVSNILEEARYPNIKELQISLTGFLGKDAASFCQSLWKLCLSAQDNPQGIPKELIEAKKAELTQEKAEKEKAREAAEKREADERERERELARTRERERGERTRGRGGRGGRDFDRRPPPRDSRSPPPRRRRDDDDFRSATGPDTYIPSASRRRRRSPSYDRSQSRSRSPQPRRRRRDSSPSRSPPRRKRRNSSNERSWTPNRSHNRAKDRRLGGDSYRRSRSPRKRRSSSPRRDSRKASSQSRRSRSPPSKRNRRSSPSPNRARKSESVDSATPPPQRKKETQLASDDLMAANRRKDSSNGLRLGRETSNLRLSRSETPPTDNGSLRTGSAAEEEESFSFKGAAARSLLSADQGAQPPSTAQQQRITSLRGKMLKEQLMVKYAPFREKQKAGAAGQSQQ